VPYASKWMCSKQCGCDENAARPWSLNGGQTEDKLKKLGRTHIQTDLDDTDGTVRLHFINKETNAAKPVDNQEVIFNSFADCFYDWKNEWSGKKGDVPVNWEKSAQDDFEAIDAVFTSVELVEYLWLTEQCNGICEYGLFSFAGVTGDGPPTKECQTVAKNLFNDSGPMIIAWLSSGVFVTFFAMILSLPLCVTYKPKEIQYKNLNFDA